MAFAAALYIAAAGKSGLGLDLRQKHIRRERREFRLVAAITGQIADIMSIMVEFSVDHEFVDQAHRLDVEIDRSGGRLFDDVAGAAGAFLGKDLREFSGDDHASRRNNKNKIPQRKKQSRIKPNRVLCWANQL